MENCVIQVVKIMFAMENTLMPFPCTVNQSELLQIQPQITRDSQQITRNPAAYLFSLNLWLSLNSMCMITNIHYGVIYHINIMNGTGLVIQKRK